MGSVTTSQRHDLNTIRGREVPLQDRPETMLEI
jgi:hypothetical protein